MAMKCWPWEFVNFIDSADIGMIRRGGGSRSSLEAIERAAIVGVVFGGRNFRATARPSFVSMGLVDDAHAAAAELFSIR